MKRSLTRKPRLNEAWNYTCCPTETCIGSTLLEVHVMIFLTSEQSLQLNAVFQHAGVLFDSPPKLLVHFQASGAFSKGKKMTAFSYAHSCQSSLLCHMLLSPLIAGGWTQHSAVTFPPNGGCSAASWDKATVLHGGAFWKPVTSSKQVYFPTAVHCSKLSSIPTNSHYAIFCHLLLDRKNWAS